MICVCFLPRQLCNNERKNKPKAVDTNRAEDSCWKLERSRRFEANTIRKQAKKKKKNEIKNVRDWKSFGKDFFLRFVPHIVCIAFHSSSAYDEICVFVFIHFSRDLTFYYVCALKLEGEKKSFSFSFFTRYEFYFFASSFSTVHFHPREPMLAWFVYKLC